MSAAAGRYIHANALRLGETGLLLRGPSRAGKSALTLALISHAEARGEFARLVGDDRVSVEAIDGRLVARPHPAIAGMIEARGVGILQIPYEPACALHAIVDLAAPEALPSRHPTPQENEASLAGIVLPRLHMHARSNDSVAQIIFFVQRIRTI